MLGSYYRSSCLGVLIVGCASAYTAAAQENEPLEVVVSTGDSLSSIVIRETGNSDPALWARVAAFNNRTVDQTLEIGDIVLLPADLFGPQTVILEEVSQSSVTEPEPVTQNTPAEDTPATPIEPATDNEECDDQQVCFDVQVTKTGPAADDSTESFKADDAEVSAQLPTNTTAALQVQQDEDAVEETTVESDDAAAQTAPVEQTTQTEDASVSATESAAAPEVASQPPQPPEPKPSKPEPPKPQPPNSESQATEQAEVTPPRPKTGLFEVDEDAATRALERSLIQLNALLLRPRRAEVTVNYDYSYDATANPLLVSVEDLANSTTVQQVGQLENEVHTNTVTVDLKFGLPYDSQVSLSVPVSFVDRETGVVVPGAAPDIQETNANGMGDFAVSVDKTLAVESGRRPDIILSAAYNSDSGASEIGSDASEFTLGVRATKRQDPLVFTASASQTFAQESGAGIRAGNVTQFSIGTLLAASPYTSLQFLFNQALVAESELDGQTLPNSDSNIASFSTGVSSVLGRDLFFNAQLAIGLVEKARDYRLSFSIAKQFSF